MSRPGCGAASVHPTAYWRSRPQPAYLVTGFVKTSLGPQQRPRHEHGTGAAQHTDRTLGTGRGRRAAAGDDARYRAPLAWVDAMSLAILAPRSVRSAAKCIRSANRFGGRFTAGALPAASTGVAENFLRLDRRAPGRAGRVHGLSGARPFFGFAASRLAILLPAIVRACVDCPSRVSSSLVAPELGGRFHVRDLPLFQFSDYRAIARQGAGHCASSRNSHGAVLSGIRSVLNRRDSSRHGLNVAVICHA
jgi:hypothetical protein